MAPANTVRGEVTLRLGEVEYVLKPEHERIVRLDDALEHGVLGTLLQLTQEQPVFKLRVLATVVHHLADDSPGVERLLEQVSGTNLLLTATVVTATLSACAAGRRDPGNGGAPSEGATA